MIYFWQQIKVHNFEREELKHLLTFEAYEPFFIFDGEYYTQIDGAAMGYPLGPTFANAFLCHFKKKWLLECPVEFLPNVCKRYVDDIFVTFNSYSQLLKFVDYTNHILRSSSLSKLKKKCFIFRR